MNIDIFHFFTEQGPGKASLKIGLGVLALFAAYFGCSAVVGTAFLNPLAGSGEINESMALLAFVAIFTVGLASLCVIVVCLLGSFIALGAGIAGLFDRERPKGAAILGLLINTPVLVVIGGYVILVVAISVGLAMPSTTANWNDWSAAWSPDGTQIAFVSDRDGNAEIYVMNADGSQAARLTTDPGGDYNPAWSPDGTQIAFYSERDGNGEIYVLNVDTLEETRLTDHPAGDFAPDWSPDGGLIAFQSHRLANPRGCSTPGPCLFVMNADGSEVVLLSDHGWSPVWSPDGAKIVFNSARFNNRDIWLMNADSSGMTRITRNPGDDWWPDWSPDGTQVTFHSDRDGTFAIYTMNADGSEQSRLTDPAYPCFDPAWSPDGAQIAYTSTRGSFMKVWKINVDGTGEIELNQSSAGWLNRLFSQKP